MNYGQAWSKDTAVKNSTMKHHTFFCCDGYNATPDQCGQSAWISCRQTLNPKQNKL